jgi:hypothetical protein
MATARPVALFHREFVKRMTGRWPIRTLAHDDALVVMPFSLFVPPFYRERNADFWRYFILESPTSDNNTWRNQSKFCQEACFLRAARQCNPVAGRRKPNLRREPALSAPQLFHWFFQAPLQRCPSRIAGPPCLWRGSPADFRHTNGCVTPLPIFGKGSGSVGALMIVVFQYVLSTLQVLVWSCLPEPSL